MELLGSRDPADVVAARLRDYGSHASAQARAPSDRFRTALGVDHGQCELRVVTEKTQLVSDVGVAGHMNGVVDAGETISINLPLRNEGTRAYRSTSCFLIARDKYATVDSTEVVYAGTSVQAGASVVFGPGTEVAPKDVFVFSVSPECPDGHHLALELLVWDTDLGRSTISMAVTVTRVGPLTFGRARIDDDVPGRSDGNGDGGIDPGETIEYVLGIRNQGVVDVEQVEATLRASGTSVTLETPTLRYAAVTGDAEREIAASFVFRVAEQVPAGERTPILTLSTTGVARGVTYRWTTVRQERVVGAAEHEPVAPPRTDDRPPRESKAGPRPPSQLKGQLAPEIVVKEWILKPPAESLKDLRGRAVLLEFFATW